jgi:hypothetical protein
LKLAQDYRKITRRAETSTSEVIFDDRDAPDLGEGPDLQRANVFEGRSGAAYFSEQGVTTSVFSQERLVRTLMISSSDRCPHREDGKSVTGYLYSILLGLVAVVAVAVSSFVLHRLDRLLAQDSPPWWLTWKRTALLTLFAFTVGVIGSLGVRTAVACYLTLTGLAWPILPFVYRQLGGVGVWGFRVEQVALWSAMMAGLLQFGEFLDLTWPVGGFTLILFLFASWYGAFALRHGFRKGITWSDSQAEG